MNQDTFRYDNRIVRAFAIATVIWGLVGFLAGLLIACQLFLPPHQPHHPQNRQRNKSKFQ